MRARTTEAFVYVGAEPAGHGLRPLRVIRLWLQRQRQRTELLQMSERELKELGLTPSDQRWIATTAFWRYPPFHGSSPSNNDL